MAISDDTEAYADCVSLSRLDGSSWFGVGKNDAASTAIWAVESRQKYTPHATAATRTMTLSPIQHVA